MTDEAVEGAAVLDCPSSEPDAAGAHVGPVLEELVYREGLLALQHFMGSAGLRDFPKRPNGTPVMLKQKFFENLLSGTFELSDFPTPDVVAAHADFKRLSLVQLLFIHCHNLDLNTTGPGMRTQAEFLARVTEHLETCIAGRLATEGGPAVPSGGAAGELVRLVVLIYGAHHRIGGEAPRSLRWLVRAGPVEGMLDLQECRLLALASEGPAPVAYCHRNLSRASAAVPKAKRQLHWEVVLSENPKEFNSTPARAEPQRRPRLSGARIAERDRRVAPGAPEGGGGLSPKDAANSPSAASTQASGAKPASVKEAAGRANARVAGLAAEPAKAQEVEVASKAGAEAKALGEEAAAAKEAASKVSNDAPVTAKVAGRDESAEAEGPRTELGAAKEVVEKEVVEKAAAEVTMPREEPRAAEEAAPSAEVEEPQAQGQERLEEAADSAGAAATAVKEAASKAEDQEQPEKAANNASAAATTVSGEELARVKEAASKATAKAVERRAELHNVYRVAGKADAEAKTLRLQVDAAQEAASKLGSDALGLRGELSAAKEAAGKAAAEAQGLRTELDAAKEAAEKAAAEAAALREELRAAKEAAPSGNDEDLGADFNSAKEVADKAGAEAEQLRADLAAAREAKSQATLELEALRKALEASRSEVEALKIQVNSAVEGPAKTTDSAEFTDAVETSEERSEEVPEEGDKSSEPAAPNAPAGLRSVFGRVTRLWGGR